MTTTTTTVLAPREHERLRDDLQQILTAADEEARQVASRLAARAYWKVGKRLLKSRLSEQAGYRAQVLADLADDLGVGERLLREAETFARAYPKRPTDANLGWSHYRELLRLQDPERRALYAERASEDELTVRALRSAIREGAYDTSSKQKRASPNKKTRTLPRPTEPSYIYRAHVDRVVDGDTVDLTIDLGFDVLTRRRIRLAAIDTPPNKTAAGRAATRYVTERLAAARTVVVQTRKFDLHGRYVAHLFYTPDDQPLATVFQQGTHLNAELLKTGHAIPFKP
ncbi:MAG: DUF1016 N-terminal domain-containing protein [Myxococcota bacterium]